MKKRDSINQLRIYLKKLFNARYEGTSGLAYAQQESFADGYMEALTDLAFVIKGELLIIIGEERSNAAALAEKQLLEVAKGGLPAEHFA
jgi:hypothetical protein